MWARIEPLLPDRARRRGGRWSDHRPVVEAICWRFRTGSPWRAAIVAARAQRLTVHSDASAETLHQADGLFHRIDARLVQVIEHGTSERLYLLRVKLPQLLDQSEGLVHQTRVRYVPVDSPVQTRLLEAVRSRLRPPPEQPHAPQAGGSSRADFEAAITHRPPRRGVTPDGPSI